MIKGYRELTADEEEAVNELKEIEEALLTVVDKMPELGADPRWVAIGKTHVEQGFMALVRSITKPERLKPERPWDE